MVKNFYYVAGEGWSCCARRGDDDLSERQILSSLVPLRTAAILEMTKDSLVHKDALPAIKAFRSYC